MSDDEFEKRGINIILLRAIRDLALVKNNDKDFWSIGAISAYMVGNHELLKPDSRWKDVNVLNCLTYNDKLSLINMLEIHYNSERTHPLLNVTYNQVVNKKANVFVSFAYATNYIELVDAVENYLIVENKDEKTTFFWFDVFVNNQWIAAEKSFQWWANTFKTAVEEIGETLLILTPWESPVMLTRAWCLYEISCSKKLSIGMSKDQNLSFNRELKRTKNSVLNTIWQIDLEKANAWLKEDKNKIFDVVRSIDGGFHKFNTIVMSLMKQWITNQLRKISFEFVDSTTDKLSFEQIKEVTSAGRLFNQMGNYDEAHHSYLKVKSNLEQYYDLTPIDSEEFVQYTIILNNLAINSRRRNKLDESEKYFKMAIKNYETVFGNESQSTLECMGNYANCLRNLQRLGEAREIYERVVKIMEKTLGLYDHRVLRNLDNLGNTVSDQGLFQEAQEMYEKVLRGYEVIGQEHSGYMDTLNNIAINLKNLGRMNEAIIYYEKAFKLSEQRLGLESQDTLGSLKNYAMALHNMGRKNDALFYFNRLIEGLKKIGDPLFQVMEKFVEMLLKQKDAELNLSGGDDIIDSSTSMTNYDRIHLVKKYKEKGSSLYKNALNQSDLFKKLLPDALRYYNLSLDHLTKVINENDDVTKEVTNLKLTLYLNVAQCFLKLEAWNECITNCNLALKIEENNSKALYRRGSCYEELKKFDLALSDYLEAKKYSSDSVIVLAEERVRKELSKEQSMKSKEQLIVTVEEYEQLVEKFYETRNIDSISKSVLLEKDRKLLREGDIKTLNESARFLLSVVGTLKPTMSASEKEINEDMLANSLVESVIVRAREAEEQGLLEKAKEDYDMALDMLEALHGLEYLKTIKTSVDYAGCLSKLGLVAESNHVCKNLLDIMASKLGSSNEIIIKCKQLQHQNSQSDKINDFKPYHVNFSTEKLKEFAQLIYQFDTDCERKEIVRNLTMKVIEESKNNSKKINRLGVLMNILLDVFRFPSYAHSVKMSKMFCPVTDLYCITEAVIKYQNSLQELDKEDFQDTTQDERIVVGKYLEESGEFEEAKSWFEKILTDYEEEYGLDDSRTDEISIHFARVVFKMKNYGESKQIYKRLVAAREATLGLSHPTITLCRKAVAECQSAIDSDDQPEVQSGAPAVQSGIAECQSAIDDDDQPEVQSETPEVQSDAPPSANKYTSKYTRTQIEEWAGIVHALNPKGETMKADFDKLLDYIKTATDSQLDGLGNKFTRILGIDETELLSNMSQSTTPSTIPSTPTAQHDAPSTTATPTATPTVQSTAIPTSQSTTQSPSSSHSLDQATDKAQTESASTLLPLLSLLSIKELLQQVKVFNLESKAVQLREKSEYVQLLFTFIKDKMENIDFEEMLFAQAANYKSSGNLVAARSLYEKVWEIQKEHYGASKDTLITANNLASTIFDIGVKESSTDMLNESTRIREETLSSMETTLGSLSPEYLACCYNLAQNYWVLGLLEKARQLYEKSLHGRDTVIGLNHLQTLDTAANLARIITEIISQFLKCEDKEKTEEELSEKLTLMDYALELFNRALDGKKGVLGASHTSTVNCKASMDIAEKVKTQLVLLSAKDNQSSISEPKQQQQHQQQQQQQQQANALVNTDVNYTREQLEEWAGVIKAVTAEHENDPKAEAIYEATIEFLAHATEKQLNEIGDQMKILLNVVTS